MSSNNLDALKDREITVLMGGWSAEREISLNTGRAVTDSIKSLGLKVRDVDLTFPEEIEKIISSLDLVFIALHGRGGEDGYIQNILEESRIQFTGSNSGACEVAMNKVETKKIWRDLSLPTPDFVEIRNAGTPNLETIPFLSGENDVSVLDASFVVKPAREGSSFGISIVHPEGKISLEDAMKEAIKYDDILMVEAFVEGEEITVPILGEETLTPITIKPKNLFYDFEAKYLRKDTEYLKSDLNFEPLAEFLVEEGDWLDVTIISDSPLLEHDAMYMKLIMERVEARRQERMARREASEKIKESRKAAAEAES